MRSGSCVGEQSSSEWETSSVSKCMKRGREGKRAMRTNTTIAALGEDACKGKRM